MLASSWIEIATGVITSGFLVAVAGGIDRWLQRRRKERQEQERSTVDELAELRKHSEELRADLAERNEELELRNSRLRSEVDVQRVLVHRLETEKGRLEVGQDRLRGEVEYLRAENTRLRAKLERMGNG